MLRHYLFPITFTMLLLLAVVAVQAHFLLQATERNRDLRDSLELLESTLEEQLQENRRAFDSLQLETERAQQDHRLLEHSLVELEAEKTRISHESRKKKAAVGAIDRADSLYREIAGHYAK